MDGNLKRKGLVLALAVAIDETLGLQHALSLPNAKRYVTREIMQKHRIRRETKVELADWLYALQVVRLYRLRYFGTDHYSDKNRRLIRMRWINDRQVEVTRLFYHNELTPAKRPS